MKTMKRFLLLVLAAVLVLSLVSCGTEDINKKSEGVMTWAEFNAAELETPVTIEAYVQAKQGWWVDDAGQELATFYLQDADGAYFVYNLNISEADYNKLTIGKKVKISGTKTAWSGEVEIIDATYEILDGNYVAEPTDVTALLGTDELIKHQNKFVSFKDLTLVKVEYKNGAPGDDIYVTVSKDGAEYSFCVEIYLTGADTDVYKAFATLQAGDIVDIEGFLYWYEGVNTHITAVTKK